MIVSTNAINMPPGTSPAYRVIQFDSKVGRGNADSSQEDTVDVRIA